MVALGAWPAEITILKLAEFAPIHADTTLDLEVLVLGEFLRSVAAARDELGTQPDFEEAEWLVAYI